MRKRRLLALSLTALCTMSVLVVWFELAPRTNTRVQVISKWEALRIASKIALEEKETLADNATVAATLELYHFTSTGYSGGVEMMFTVEVDPYTGLPRQELFYPTPPLMMQLQDVVTQWRGGCIKYMYIWDIPIKPPSHPWSPIFIDATTGESVYLYHSFFTCRTP